MKMSLHSSEDWCHLCGRRSSPLVDIDYLENAEHQTGKDRYIRICATCGERMAKITASDQPTLHTGDSTTAECRSIGFSTAQLPVERTTTLCASGSEWSGAQRSQP